jgi:hypothetical protein
MWLTRTLFTAARLKFNTHYFFGKLFTVRFRVYQFHFAGAVSI